MHHFHNLFRNQFGKHETDYFQINNILLLISFLLILLVFFPSCTTFNSLEYQKEIHVDLVDSSATRQTVNLFANLKNVAGEKILFGHQDATKYGVGWSGIPDKSDVKDVTGSYPALYGWDFGGIASNDSGAIKDNTKEHLLKAAKRGGISAFCWHNYNPVTGKNFYDTTIAVPHILKGGSHYDTYKKQLDRIADYSNTLKDENGNLVPIIFRPYHEFDGNWFWWGKPFCTADEFKQLWRETVDYLRMEKKVQNLIYAFSPDCRFKTRSDFLERYPGDDYVDMIGMDNYWDFGPNGDGLKGVRSKLAILTQYADEHGKIAAMTETGLESIPDSTWWTKTLHPIISEDSIKIAFVMVWRNANKKHHYAPFPGDTSADDFVKFRNEENIYFESDLPDLYNSVYPKEFFRKPKKK